MKQFLLPILLMMAFNLFGQGIEFFHGTWEEALEKAKAAEQLIFVDAYAKWCGPCKRMAKNTFTQKHVGEFFNSNFLNVKMDMESSDAKTFRKHYPVSSYPTLLFINGDGEVVSKGVGAKKPDDLIKMGEFAISQFDVSEDYAAAYEKGDRDPELIYNYVKALNKMGKPSLKIVNDYLKTQTDMTTEDNLKFIQVACSEADSKVFDLLIQHRPRIEAASSKEAVLETIEAACTRTAEKAIEFESNDLHEEAKAKMKKYYPEKAQAFTFDRDMKFYLATHNAKAYMKCCSNFAKKEVKNNASQLHDLAKIIQDNFHDNGSAMKQAEKYAGKAAENGGLANYYYTYANILMLNGKKSKALQMARKSLELAEGDRAAAAGIEKLIHKIEEG